jgi:hypothetical protein
MVMLSFAHVKKNEVTKRAIQLTRYFLSPILSFNLSCDQIKKSISFEFWKNGVTASVGARGPERNAPEASVGLPFSHRD